MPELTVDGIRYAYLDEGSGPLILFGHGLAAGKEMFAAQIAVSATGTGASPSTGRATANRAVRTDGTSTAWRTSRPPCSTSWTTGPPSSPACPRARWRSPGSRSVGRISSTR